MTTNNKYSSPVVFHPGETLAEKLAEMGLSQQEFALRTGEPEKTIVTILKGVRQITPNIAMQFERVTKIPMHFWMNHQRCYDAFTHPNHSK